MKFKKLLDVMSLAQPIYVATWHEGKLCDNFRVDSLPQYDPRCIALANAKVHEHGVFSSHDGGRYIFIDLEI